MVPVDCLARRLPAGCLGGSGRCGTRGLDPTFGHGGKVLTTFPQALAVSGSGLAVHPDGKLLVAGTSNRAGGLTDFALVT
jgi:hypothetical protein